MITQRQWRKYGAITLAAATAMALYAVFTRLLHNTAMVLIAMFSERVADEAAGIARFPILAFWAVFGLLMCATLYFAMIDIRHIRVQYAAERREILRHTLQDEQFRETLRDRTTPRGSNGISSNGR